MVNTARDIFDEVSDGDIFNQVDSTEDISIEKIRSEMAALLEKFDGSERKKENGKITSELKQLIKSEISKIKPVQNIIERQIEQIVKHETVPFHIEPKIIQAPPRPAPPPQIIREILVEVEKKDLTKYAKEELVSSLEKRIKDLTDELENVKTTFSMMGGSGVIGLPNPQGNSGKTIQVVGGQWVPVTPSSGSGGLAPGTFTITNNNPLYTFDSTGDTVDNLYQIVATLIRKLQGEI